MKTILMFAALTLASACTTQVVKSEAPEDVVLPEQRMVQQEVPASATTAESPDTAPVPAGKTETPAAAPAVTTETRYELPAWSLEDVQPKSARHQQRYGLESYAGKTIVVVLLEGHCPYCQSNSVVAQRLQDDLAAEKLDVQVVILADLNATQFASKVSLPIFRDADGKAWESMRANASKHDTFVFGPDGKRTYFWLGSYQGDASRWTTEVGAAARAVAKPQG